MKTQAKNLSLALALLALSSFNPQLKKLFGRVLVAVTIVLELSAPAVIRAQSGNAPTNLYSFTGQSDGSQPMGGLTAGGDGCFYGTTEDGGANGYGTIFKINSSGVLSNLYSFTDLADGASPQAPLVLGSDGELYGTTAFSGFDASAAEWYGAAVFKISTNGAFTSYPVPGTWHLFNFERISGLSGLLSGVDGNIYGTTTFGGANDQGMIFKMTTAGVFTEVYSFTGGTNGVGGDVLAAGQDGNIYGISGTYGLPFTGTPTNTTTTIFQLTYGGVYTALYAFTNASILGGGTLIAANDGNLYGASFTGGTNGSGMLFRITTNGIFTTLWEFGGFGGYMYGVEPITLTQGIDGNLYGMTANGGINGSGGMIFEMTTNDEMTLIGSLGAGGSNPYYPASLVQDGSGRFYGTTSYGGADTNGAVFEFTITPDPAIVTILPATNATAYAGASYELLYSSPTIFTVYANGALPLSYQWLKNGSPLIDAGEISGSTNSGLAINPVFSSDAGTYAVVVTNYYGSVTSSPCTLTVTPDTRNLDVFINSPASAIRSATPVLSLATYESVSAVSYWITNLNGSPTITGSVLLPAVGVPLPITNVLYPGTNILAAQSCGFSSNFSPVTSQAFFYKIRARLAVVASGEGNASFSGRASVGGDTTPANGAMLNIGECYSITATASKGFEFVTWRSSTGLVSNNRTLAFIMETNLLLMAYFADTNPPVVAITNVPGGLAVSTSSFTLKGTASDNVAVSNVWCRENSKGWMMATPGTTWSNWTATVTLTPGTNVIQAYAVDTSGNVSKTNTVKLVYVLSAVLTVNVGPGGTVVTNYNGKWLQIGRTYSMTAKTNAGFAFTGWTGSMVTNSAKLTFVMASNLVFSAKFVETARPKLTISSPPNGQRTTNAVAHLAGKATDDWGVGGVWLQLNGDSWTLASTTNAYTNWSATVALVAGTNRLQAYALNLGGNYSTTNNLSIVSSNSFKLRFNVAAAKLAGADGPTFSLLLSTNLAGCIQVSSNLINWVDLTNFAGSNASVTFHDPAAGNSAPRFYRAVVP